jgi:His-Xaa-Ser system radical SAM maturase HxsB
MSKFYDLAKYEIKQEYKLLPFKFDRLNDREYILTNMVGEYEILPNEIFQKAVNHKLENESHYFANLRSKHFIFFENEQSPIELLALKYRTKYSRLANFTNLHIFVVTLRCDHSCPYCQVSRQSENKEAFDMTEATADKALDFVFRSPNEAIKIEFQGGESLLNFDLIKYIVLKAKEINKKEKRELEFVIATTLSLLTDEMLQFCKTHEILLSSSLDGHRELHNANRPRKGSNSHEKFIEGLSKAREVLGYDKVSALMTTTEGSLNCVKEIIDEYVRLGFNGIFLRSLSPYGFAIKTKKYVEYKVERWLDFYKEGLEYIIQLNKNGIPFVEQYSAMILTKILTSSDSGFVDLMTPSGIGIAAIVFNYDAKVYASDESRMLAEMNDETFCLGHLHENSYEEIILSEKLLQVLEDSFTLSVPQCSDCAFEPYCGAEPIYHHAIYKDILGRKPSSSFCSKNMTIFKHLIDLMRNDQETKNIFLGWANRC